MLNVDQIEEWLGQEALDSEGERVGKLDEVFYSASTGEATFAAIKSGLLGRHSSIVPLAGASVGRDYVRLAYTAAQIERAGSEVKTGDSLERGDAGRLGQLYGVEVAPDDDYEAASAIGERAQAAEDARRRAEELDEEARRRAGEAQEAEGVAHGAQDEAAEKARAAERARADAEQARAEMERLDPQ